MDRIAPQPDASPPHRLKTFGEALLRHADGQTVIRPSKPLALLTYLHFAPGRSATRDYLCSLLWGESSPGHAMGTLRTTLHRLHAQLGELAAEGGATTVRLKIHLVADRDDFLAALDRGDFATAVARYDGPFFPEYADPGAALFEQWADGERARLRELFVRAAESLIRTALDGGHFRDAVRQARHLRSHAPDSETGWRLLLESLLLAKDDLAARSEAEAFRTWLEQDALEPEPASRRVMERIREGGAAPPEGQDHGGLVAELIARERPFAAALRAWDSVRRGRSHHLHVSAPAGIGKTRFLADLGARLATGGARVVSVRANIGERSLDYAHAADLARALSGLPGAKGLSPRTAGILISLQPALAAVFAAAAPVATSDLLLQRAQAIAELIAAVSDEAPVAILIDDTHWVDEASRRILRSVAGRLDRGRVLLVTAGRPPEIALPTNVPASTITLDPLLPAEVEAFLGSLAELPDTDWAATLVTALHRATKGSPLRLLETLQLARARVELSVVEGVWTSPAPDKLLAHLATADATVERLRALDDESHDLARFLAVSGAPLRASDLATLAGRPQGAVDMALVSLERQGLAGLAGDRWTPAHDEIGSAVLALASPAAIQDCHRKLGQQFAADPTQLQRAVRHLVFAGDEGALGAIARRWCLAHHRAGDTRPATALLSELLGDDLATATRLAQVRRDLPYPLRSGWHGRRMAGAAIGLVAAVVGAKALPQTEAPPPEATLLFAVPRPDSSGFSLYQVGIREDPSRPNDSLTPRQGKPIGVWHERPTGLAAPKVRPGGGALVGPRSVPDSGQVDLFLHPFEGEDVRLTASAGDDIDPNWSPDGRQIVFATARWTPRGDRDLDIAILDPSTGNVRPLTSGTDYDHSPAWSPDGTRIAFFRRVTAGPPEVCWMTLESAPTCQSAPGTPFYLAGWRDGKSLIGVAEGRRWLSIAVASGLATPLPVEIDATFASISPDGKWVVAGMTSAGPLWRLVAFPLARPDHRIALALGAELGTAQVAWIPPVPGRSIEHLTIADPGAVVDGVSHHLQVDPTDSTGAVVAVPDGVLRWHITDTAMATIDSLTGLVRPRRTGTVAVEVSAGGWRRATRVIVIEPNIPVARTSERWADSTMPGWRRLGSPVPFVMTGEDGRRALAINGDETFASGVLALGGMASRRGAGVEVEVSTPIRRDKWQQFRLSLVGQVTITGDGMPNSTGACSYHLPTGEGWGNADRMGFNTGSTGFGAAAPPALTSGAWYRVRLQLFPDGTCGVALNGRPIWRSRGDRTFDPELRVLMHGQSVGTVIAVRSVDAWEGVREGIDWHVRGHARERR